MTQDGECIEQALRGMFVEAVASVHDRDIQMTRENMRCSRRGMSHDDEINAESAQSVSGIEERFAFLDAGSRRGDDGGRCTQGFRRELERDAGAGGRLIEEKRDAM